MKVIIFLVTGSQIDNMVEGGAWFISKIKIKVHLLGFCFMVKYNSKLSAERR